MGVGGGGDGVKGGLPHQFCVGVCKRRCCQSSLTGAGRPKRGGKGATLRWPVMEHRPNAARPVAGGREEPRYETQVEAPHFCGPRVVC